MKGQEDLCFIYRRDNHGLCIIALYADDCDCTALDKDTIDIKQVFDIKIKIPSTIILVVTSM